MQLSVLSAACIWGWNWELRSSIRRPAENLEYDQTIACPTLLNSMDTAESAEVTGGLCGLFFLCFFLMTLVYGHIEVKATAY